MKAQIGKAELKIACTYNRNKLATVSRSEIPLSNNWKVWTERHYPLPARPGPAWYPCYYLISPTGKVFGGYGDAKSFVSYFGNPYGWQWQDDYRANGFQRTESK